MGVDPIQSFNRSVRVHTDDINCAPAPVYGDVGKENRRSFPQILQKQSGGHDCSLVSAPTPSAFFYPLTHLATIVLIPSKPLPSPQVKALRRLAKLLQRVILTLAMVSALALECSGPRTDECITYACRYSFLIPTCTLT